MAIVASTSGINLRPRDGMDAAGSQPAVAGSTDRTYSRAVRRSLSILAILCLALAATGPVASGAGTTYKGKIGTDKSQKLSFKVSGGKVRKWKAVKYASCFGGNQLTTLTIPATKLKGGKFSRRYQPVPSSETYLTVKGKVSGGKASGTVVQTGACSFEKTKWKAKKK